MYKPAYAYPTNQTDQTPTHILNKALTHIGKLPNNSYPDKLTQMIILITNSSKEKNQNKEGEEKAPRRKAKTYEEKV